MLDYKKQHNDTYAFPYTYEVIQLDAIDSGEDISSTPGGGKIVGTRVIDPKASQSAANTITLMPDDAMVNDNVVKKIIGNSIARVEGVLGQRGNVMENITGAFSDNEVTRGINLHTQGSQAEVEVKVMVLYGASIPEIIKAIQENVHRDLLAMAGLNASRIQVDITDVLTQKEYDEKYNKGRKE